MYELREIERKDIKIINQWRNDKELQKHLGGVYRYINEEVDEAWYERYLQQRDHAVRCAIVKIPEDRIVGVIYLLNIDSISLSGDLHIMIGAQDDRGQGVGTFAVNEMINHAFGNLNLRRIQLEVLENNSAARRLYEKAGFAVEGIKREAVYKDGKYLDAVIMGLLREDNWEGNYKQGTNKMNVYGKKVYLRAPEPDDMELYRKMANDPETERLIGGWSFPISVKEQNEWYERILRDKKNLRFTIAIQETDEVIGMVNLIDIDWKNGSAFHGIRMADQKGKGYGTDAVMTLMRYAFEELRLVRLDGSFVENNIHSQNLYKKCGWTIEGTKKKAIYKDGKHYNLLIAGITDDEYYAIKKVLNY